MFDERKLTKNPPKQQLDSKTLSRLESAVARSQYVGQGKKLKVTNKVRCHDPPI